MLAPPGVARIQYGFTTDCVTGTPLYTDKGYDSSRTRGQTFTIGDRLTSSWQLPRPSLSVRWPKGHIRPFAVFISLLMSRKLQVPRRTTSAAGMRAASKQSQAKYVIAMYVSTYHSYRSMSLRCLSNHEHKRSTTTHLACVRRPLDVRRRNTIAVAMVLLLGGGAQTFFSFNP